MENETKKCKNCGMTLEKNKLKCPKCNKINFKSDKFFAIISISIIVLLFIIGSLNTEQPTNNNQSDSNQTENSNQNLSTKLDFTIEDTGHIKTSHAKINEIVNQFYDEISKKNDINILEFKSSKYNDGYYNVVVMTAEDDSSITFKFDSNDKLLLLTSTAPNLKPTETFRKLNISLINVSYLNITDANIKSIVSIVNEDKQIESKQYGNIKIDNAPNIGVFSITISEDAESVDNNSKEDNSSTSKPTNNSSTNDKTNSSNNNNINSNNNSNNTSSNSNSNNTNSNNNNTNSNTTNNNANSNTNNSTNNQNAENSITVSQQQALRKAKDYLSVMAFSHEGLIEQLKFEGFSDSDSRYGADNCGANWDSQALKKAKNYLDTMAFSYSGLKKQLEFEKFTSSQATYAVNNCGADWNEQAVKKARNYLDVMAFSRDGLIEQLKFEGFTQSQAEYGVSQVGL